MLSAPYHLLDVIVCDRDELCCHIPKQTGYICLFMIGVHQLFIHEYKKSPLISEGITQHTFCYMVYISSDNHAFRMAMFSDSIHILEYESQY